MPPPAGRPPTWILQRRLCQAIIGKEGTKEYTEYTEMMRRQVLAGICPPALHTLFLHYGYGKPVEEIEVTEKPADPISNLSEDELRDRARRLALAKFIVPPADSPNPDEDDPKSSDGDTVQ